MDKKQRVPSFGWQCGCRNRTGRAIARSNWEQDVFHTQIRCKELQDAIRIGLVADEPIRLAGLASVFEQPAQEAHAQLLPVIGSMEELLAMEASSTWCRSAFFRRGLKSMDNDSPLAA